MVGVRIEHMHSCVRAWIRLVGSQQSGIWRDAGFLLLVDQPITIGPSEPF